MKLFVSTPLLTLACFLSSSLAQNSTEPTIEPTLVPTASPVQTVEPTTSEPTEVPETEEPTTATPSFVPSTASPTIVPTSAAPTTAEPTEIPETEEPTTASPTLIPTTAEPSLQPTTVQPTTAEPTVPEETEAPTSSSPTALPTAAPLISIYEIISNSTPTLAFLVSAAGLEGTLSDPNANFTLFSPLESAFAALPNEIALYLLGNVDTVLSPLLLGHVLPFVAPASAVVSLDGEEVEFANGVSQTITVTGNEVSLSAGGDDFVGTAKVVSVDIFASNGVIHEIDRILGVPTIFEFLGATQYAALLGAISVSGLSGELAMASDVTLFAPTTSGFLSLANEYPDLAGVVLDDPGFQLHAADMVLAHMVPNSVAFSGDLADGDVLTMANGENVTVVISNGNVGISPGSVNGTAPVSAVDGVTTQGVIHTLSGVIVPSYLTKTVVDIAVIEAPTAAELVIQAGLDTTLAEGFPFTRMFRM